MQEANKVCDAVDTTARSAYLLAAVVKIGSGRSCLRPGVRDGGGPFRGDRDGGVRGDNTKEEAAAVERCL